MNVRKFIDLHVHIGPEPIQRKFTANDIVKIGAGRLAGIAVKNHFYPTVSMINAIKIPKEFTIIASITLNNYVGGLNPEAVSSSAQISKNPIIVWFPTINAENFLRKSEFEIPPEWCSSNVAARQSKNMEPISIIGNRGRISKNAEKVLLTIKKYECILATGHISWQESMLLVERALAMGIKKVIVTHPIYQKISMPLNEQKRLVQNEGVYIEQAYSMNLIDKIPIRKIVQQIKYVGAEKCILTSDVGQINSPNPGTALKEFCRLLMKEGITKEELKIMGEINPRKLIAFKKR